MLPEIRADYPDITWTFQGSQAEMRESTQALWGGFALAMLAVYALLAVAFSSYLQPLIVMSAIPISFIGVIFGHVVMGIDLTLLSLIGSVALAGVVVNDSLVMVDYVNRRRREGMDMREAVLTAGPARFRAILLGKGPLEESIRVHAARRGVVDHIRLEGSVDDVGAYIARAHVAVLCSQRKGLSIAILEAMKHGLPVVATDVGVQADLLEVLQQRAADTVHDALGHARSARGVHNVERMVERQLLEAHLPFDGRGEILPAHRIGNGGRINGIRIIDQHHLFNRRQFMQYAFQFFLGVEFLSFVKITIGGKNHFGFDLAEAVENAFNTEVW